MLDNQQGDKSFDSATGYINPSKPSEIKVWEKTAFLKAYRTHGDITAAATKLGYKGSDFLKQLKIDKKFNEDFIENKLDMKHELEGLMFQKALTDNGHKERLTWLETQFPEEYGKKKVEPKKKGNPVIESLMKDL